MSEFNGRIGHLYGIESPWGNAGGPVKTLEQVAAMASTQVGWIEVGSVTPEERPDLSLEGQTVYLHNPKTGETFNRFKMPNQGFSAFAVELPEMLDIAHKHHKPLIANVAPTGDEPIKEIQEMVYQSYDKRVDAVLINPDCPSLKTSTGEPRQRLSTDPAWLQEMLMGVRENVRRFRPVFLRIAPPDTRGAMNTILDVVRRSGIVSAVFVANSWQISEADVIREPRLAEWGDEGGKSGPTLAFRSANVTKWAVAELQGSGIDVVRSCGVADAMELKRSLVIGAVAAAGSTFFFEAGAPENWAEATDQLFADFS